MTQQIEHIERKVKLLVEELSNLRRQVASLSTENNKLKSDLDTQNERIAELTQRLTNTQQALAGQRGDKNSESSQKLREQIDQYISEIDNCIDWLQNA